MEIQDPNMFESNSRRRVHILRLASARPGYGIGVVHVTILISPKLACQHGRTQEQGVQGLVCVSPGDLVIIQLQVIEGEPRLHFNRAYAICNSESLEVLSRSINRSFLSILDISLQSSLPVISKICHSSSFSLSSQRSQGPLPIPLSTHISQ